MPLPDGNILLSYLDVTDSTRVEEALRERNEALETAGRLKSEFIANVSYELRTPLNAIIGFAEILANQYFGELNPRQLDYSRGILDSSNRLLSLINDILDLATIEAGYMQLETARGRHPRADVERADLDPRARAQSGPASSNSTARPISARILADERRLKQALFNLVSNALKFTPAGGTVTLGRAARAAIASRSSSPIPASACAARTRRASSRSSSAAIRRRANRAPGLGLSLVKSFIELHGGTRRARIEPGQRHHRHLLAPRPRPRRRRCARRGD